VPIAVRTRTANRNAITTASVFWLVLHCIGSFWRRAAERFEKSMKTCLVVEREIKRTVSGAAGQESYNGDVRQGEHLPCSSARETSSITLVDSTAASERTQAVRDTAESHGGPSLEYRLARSARLEQSNCEVDSRQVKCSQPARVGYDPVKPDSCRLRNPKPKNRRPGRARGALLDLLTAIFSLICRRGYSLEDAQDLYSGLFVKILERDWLQHADPNRAGSVGFC
jgi:hypothetical protein